VVLLIQELYNGVITVFSYDPTVKNIAGDSSGSCAVYPARVRRGTKVVRDGHGEFTQGSYTIHVDMTPVFDENTRIGIGSYVSGCVSGVVDSSIRTWAPIDFHVGEALDGAVFQRVII